MSIFKRFIGRTSSAPPDSDPYTLTQRLFDQKDPRGLIALLRHEDGEMRRFATLKLDSLAEEEHVDDECMREALPKLAEILVHPDFPGVHNYDAVECMLTIGKLNAIPFFIQALRDESTYLVAAWAIEIPLANMCRQLLDDGKLDRESLEIALRPATEYFMSVVQNASLVEGARPHDIRVAAARDALGAIRDPVSLPVLEELLSRINKILGGREVRKHVNDGVVEGYESSDDSLRSIREAIERIKALP